MTGYPGTGDPGRPTTVRGFDVPCRQVIHPSHGRGFPALAGSGLTGLAHAEGVVLELGTHRIIHCSGKTANDDAAETVEGRHVIVGPGDVGAQTTQVLRNIDRFLGTCGASLADVYRVRVYVVAPMTDADFAAIHRARSVLMPPECQPASTLVVVMGLARPGALIEMDAEAVVFAGSDHPPQGSTCTDHTPPGGAGAGTTDGERSNRHAT